MKSHIRKRKDRELPAGTGYIAIIKRSQSIVIHSRMEEFYFSLTSQFRISSWPRANRQVCSMSLLGFKVPSLLLCVNCCDINHITKPVPPLLSSPSSLWETKRKEIIGKQSVTQKLPGHFGTHPSGSFPPLWQPFHQDGDVGEMQAVGLLGKSC